MTRARLLQLHSAAKAIQYDGVDAIHTATNLVGEEVAIGMLMVHLRHGFNPRGTFPSPDTTEQGINVVLEHCNLISS